MTQFTHQDTYNKVVAIIAEKLSIDSSSIKETSTLHDLGADSIDLVKIIMAIEEQCGVSIDDEKAETFKNVGDVVNYVHQLRTAQ
jgi:acyl carrier protein